MSEVIVVQLNDEYSCEIKKYTGSNGQYYNFNQVNYDINFPIDWAFQCPLSDPECEFGPETCYDCFLHGYHNGVFIGYCTNCAFLCNYQRGNGLVYGMEQERNPNNSIWDLYLQNVSLEEIGDQQLHIDYHYKLQMYQQIEDDITVPYDNMEYICEEGEGEGEENQDHVTVIDNFEYYSSEDDEYNDMFYDVDSIS